MVVLLHVALPVVDDSLDFAGDTEGDELLAATSIDTCGFVWIFEGEVWKFDSSAYTSKAGSSTTWVAGVTLVNSFAEILCWPCDEWLQFCTWSPTKRICSTCHLTNVP